MKRTVLLLAAVCGASALAGCVGFVPVPAGPVEVQGAYHHHPGPPRHMRDRDGDGVPNRYDRRPGNPYRY
ncbi:hypothetical protein EZ313_06505 [Ramlibacter henchirensis]|uniref:Lipoprotein n=1 Tax=Ramlibacter henchirensis TaxID=204072 RepID=A0A4Z0C4S5_9BURK|nr:hypothetical protein [Ramlibacter henchirensis]TFZ06291.1 hypothetical protein EZ313_06505 [Ramlibacter henchirensis]